MEDAIRVNSSVCTPLGYRVLILILMEDDLRVQKVAMCQLDVTYLNPCSDGRCAKSGRYLFHNGICGKS